MRMETRGTEMMEFMDTAELIDTAETADAHEVVREALRRGVRTSPLCRAVMGWLGETATEPFIADIRRSADGWVSLRLSDEAAAETLGTYRDFVEQVRVICESLRMTETQTMQTLGWVRMRLF